MARRTLIVIQCALLVFLLYCSSIVFYGWKVASSDVPQLPKLDRQQFDTSIMALNPRDQLQSHSESIDVPQPPELNRPQFDYIGLLKESLKAENRYVTIVLNSCARLSLLAKTMESFESQLSEKDRSMIAHKIIIDDCQKTKEAMSIVEQWMNDGEWEVIFTGRNTIDHSQSGSFKDDRIHRAFDKAMGHVSTQWVYHLEDDWEFNTSFLQPSFKVFESIVREPQRYRYSIALCWDREGNWADTNITLQKYRNQTWAIQRLELVWGGFSLNAGLMPTFIWKRFAPFSQWDDEGHLSQAMMAHRLRVAMLSPPVCTHIGKSKRINVPRAPATKQHNFSLIFNDFNF